MNKPIAWMLLTSLLLGAIGCSKSKEAEIGTAPVATTGTGESPAVVPSTGAEPVVSTVEISPFIHHTPGDVALVMARPARAMSNPIVTGMIKEIEAADPSVNVADQLQAMEEQLGIDPKQIEYVVVSVSPKTLAAFAPVSQPEPDFGPAGDDFGPPPTDKSDEAAPEEKTESPCAEEPAADVAEEPVAEESVAEEPAFAEPADSDDSEMAMEDLGGFEMPPSPAVLVRLLTPIDGEAWIAKMEAKNKANVEKMFGDSDESYEGMDKEVAAELKQRQDEFRQSMLKGSEVHRSQHGGLTLYQNGKSMDRLCLLDPQTVLYAPEAVVKAAIDRKGTAAASPLSDQLQTLMDRDFAISVDLAPVAAMSKSGQLEIPFPVMLFAAPLLKCQSLSLAADINGGDLLQVNLVAADAAGAKQLHGMLNPLLLDSIAKAKAAKDGPGLPAEASPFLPLGEKMLDGTKLTQTGDLLSLVVARPAGLEDLPTLARPMLIEAAKKKAEVSKRNDLKQIGLAMHNFHETYRNFPSNDRGGSEAVGLSWRVHILPFVDEYGLYNEFHMDEAWDSEHNKALIPRMPKVYGTSPDGKSSVHVFIGEGTPFGGEPVSIRDITDGTSNTLMVVKAGDDTADIWTKPGGLTFDKADPIAALGNIGDMFDVLLMDGSARSLPKTIDAETLGNLILHNDGNPVELP